MDKPTNIVQQQANNHPYTILIVPPNLSPVEYRVVNPVSTDIIENENAKLDSTLQTPQTIHNYANQN